MMSNELLFIIQTIVGLLFTLIAFRMGRHWLYGYVGVCIVLANIFVTKQITLFGLAATGGNVVYGAVFLATDLLAEHYGKKAAREAVYIGFFAAVFYTVMSQLILFFSPSSDDWGAAAGMSSIFSAAPSIIIASLTAYLASQLHDVWAFHFIRQKTQGRFLWLRNNLSTWVSQLIDSILFSFLAFLILPQLISDSTNALQFGTVVQIVISTYLLKILVAAIDTPFIYLSYALKTPHVVAEV
ncbi:MAG: queuosine precursor transporter [Candidatus Marinimicrobia bacterium]|nr:queuosine precursor transporter [Candidatus Neomarinimicrobiota bacterium]|tara:strand:- start:1532 stop:2254 length:723 start_codon:yes stop_codon:yes gene_type:complete